MSTHTPGPWTVDKYSRIITPTREVLLVSGVALPSGNHPKIEEADANAAFIVRACNTHEDLVKACKATIAHRGKDFLDNTIEPYAGLVRAIAKAEGRA